MRALVRFGSAVLAGLILSFSAAVCNGGTVTWTGLSSTDWSDGGNWTPSAPISGDDVIITNAGNDVLLSSSTLNLASLTISNKTLIFTNWTTVLNATNVIVQNAGVLTLPGAFPTNGSASNRIHISCVDLTVESGGSIVADGGGYPGYVCPAGVVGFGGGPGFGPGAGNGSAGNYGSGGGYGGKGGYSGAHWELGGLTYGSPNAPAQAGSGGGGYVLAVPGNHAGHGGGAVRIDATGVVTIHGTVSANGGDGTTGYAGAGSGGAIWISCQRLDGSATGLLMADGGNGPSFYFSGGGGGRIAVSHTAQTSNPGVRFSTRGGTAGTIQEQFGDAGAVYLPDTALLSTNLTGQAFREVHVVGVTSWSPERLTLDNITLTFGEPGFQLNVTNDLQLQNGASLTFVGNSRVACGGDCILTNQSGLYIESGIAPLGVGYGALLAVTGALRIVDNSWLYPVCESTNGSAPFLQMTTLDIAAGSGINADGRGFSGGINFSGLLDGTDWGWPGYGPGGGATWFGNGGAGGGHGGRGGDGQNALGGITNGNPNAPILPGSGGGGYMGAKAGDRAIFGGGLIRIEATTVTLAGTISANGGTNPHAGTSYSGGGSGGGILVFCDTFAGSGLMRANGSDSLYATSGGGGGGRIAVGIALSESVQTNLLAGNAVADLTRYQVHVPFSGTISVTNGLGWHNPPDADAAAPGSHWFLSTARTLTIEGNPAEYDTPTPRSYGSHVDIPNDAWVTNSVTSPVDQAGGSRHTCAGWTLTNPSDAVIDSGTSTQAVFQFTDNMTLTWNWTNEYELTVSAGANGSVNSGQVNGWYTNATVVTNITATPSGGATFFQWSGDVPAGQQTVNPLTVTMDQKRALQANFALTTAQTNIWTGTNVWETAGNWSLNSIPGPLDHAIIASGDVTVGAGSPIEVTSLTVSNGARVVFANWTTALTVSNAVIASGGAFALPGAFPTDGSASNRISIACANLTVESGASIVADGGGYPGYTYPVGGPLYGGGPGFGPGGGGGAEGSGGGGGGFGGHGGLSGGNDALGGVSYGTSNAPVMAGSGGGGYVLAVEGNHAGHGGGAIRIDASGAVTVHGTVSANGEDATTGTGGGGSGGGIWISCQQLDGSASGLLSADGGAGFIAAMSAGGGGGGGRISVTYSAQAGNPGIRFSTRGGAIPQTVYLEQPGEDGTVYLPDRTFLSANLAGQAFRGVRLFAMTNWAPDHLTLDDVTLTFGMPGFRLDVTNDLRLQNSAALTLLGNARLNCGGDCILTNQAGLYLASGLAAPGTDYGSLLAITGMLRIVSNSWVYPSSESTNGSSPLLRMASLDIDASSGIDADGRGFSGYIAFTEAHFGGAGYGPGAGDGIYGAYGGGAGHGGLGGDGNGIGGGTIYGNTNAPAEPGSGGGGFVGYRATSRGNFGGGLIRIEASTVTLDGTLSANGGTKQHGGLSYSGGGSGGSVWLICDTVTGTGLMQADGSDSAEAVNSGGGGGGRIAVWRGVGVSDRTRILAGLDPTLSIVTNTFAYLLPGITHSTTYGTGYASGEAGTVRIIWGERDRGTMIMLR